MLFKYKALDAGGVNREGEIDAANQDVAISGLQRRGLVVVSIKDKAKKSIFQFSFLERVPMKSIVILSRQISTLFEAQVSALKSFTMLATNTSNKILELLAIQRSCCFFQSHKVFPVIYFSFSAF